MEMNKALTIAYAVRLLTEAEAIIWRHEGDRLVGRNYEGETPSAIIGAVIGTYKLADFDNQKVGVLSAFKSTIILSDPSGSGEGHRLDGILRKLLEVPQTKRTAE